VFFLSVICRQGSEEVAFDEPGQIFNSTFLVAAAGVAISAFKKIVASEVDKVVLFDTVFPF